MNNLFFTTSFRKARTRESVIEGERETEREIRGRESDRERDNRGGEN